MVYGIFQVLYVICIVVLLLLIILEYKIYVIVLDIGGGFGNKVGVYLGYICVIVVFIVIGVLVKWVEDWMENFFMIFFVCDYYMMMEIVVKKDGMVMGFKVYVFVDYGGFDVCVDLSKWFVGFFNIVIGFYDFLMVYLEVDGVYINKVLGGVVYCCFFCVMEVVYVIECVMDVFVQKL